MEKKTSYLKANFITGLILLLPLILTIGIIGFLINFLTQPFVGFVSRIISEVYHPTKDIFFFSHQNFVLYLSKFLVLVILLVFTATLGLLTRVFFMKTLLSIGDSILHRIPIVKTVYKTTQDIIKTLFASDKDSFKQVVMVQFPKDGMYMLGLIVRESPKMCSEAIGHELISVLIPTTPNPTTGFLIMVKRNELIAIDLKAEDAIKYIVSCGVIVPCEKR